MRRAQTFVSFALQSVLLSPATRPTYTILVLSQLSSRCWDWLEGLLLTVLRRGLPNTWSQTCRFRDWESWGEKTAEDGYEDGYGSETSTWVASDDSNKGIEAPETSREFLTNGERVSTRPWLEFCPRERSDTPRRLGPWPRLRPHIGKVAELGHGTAHIAGYETERVRVINFKQYSFMIAWHVGMHWVWSKLRYSTTVCLAHDAFYRHPIQVQLRKDWSKSEAVCTLSKQPNLRQWPTSSFKLEMECVWISLCLLHVEVRTQSREFLGSWDWMSVTKLGQSVSIKSNAEFDS